MMNNLMYDLNFYINLILFILNEGYTIVDYEQVDISKQHLILRHDVDFSLDYALEMAEIEFKNNIKSIYFVLTSSEFYNIHSVSNRRAMQQILKFGHEIGLHFDASIYPENDQNLENYASNECNLIEDIIGHPLRFISFHRPPPKFLGLKYKFANRINTYQKKYFHDMGYCSDSTGIWRFGSPTENESFIKKQALQLLTHPIWWVKKKFNQPIDAIEDFFNDVHTTFKKNMSDNCLPYRKHILET
ncbi:MAG: hypothetical protein JWM09_1318 [Francisellaceae bacterium]|nr:hypothetical protein [Francisellaceae bacterium]